jgi:hypothetical protein
MHHGWDLGQLLFNRDDAGEVFRIPIVDSAGCFVRCSGLRANQCLWAAAALGDVGAIVAVKWSSDFHQSFGGSASPCSRRESVAQQVDLIRGSESSRPNSSVMQFHLVTSQS